MAQLSPQTLAELRELIALHVDGYIADVYGPTTIPADRLAELVGAGLISPEQARQMEADYLQDAHLSALMVQRLEDAMRHGDQLDVQGMEAELRRNPIPLSDADRAAVEDAKQRAGEHCKLLGERVYGEWDAALAEEQREQVREATAEAAAGRHDRNWLRAEIGVRTGAYEQDLDRIAATELQNVHNAGAATDIGRRHGGGATVVKVPNPSACDDCRRLYLDGDGIPVVFELRELEGNGTNVGRRRGAWLPVVGTTHPWCACKLRRLPSGWTMDENGDLVPT